LVIVGVIIVIFLWGPQKLPELAKSIGRAKQEFDKAAKEATATVEKTITTTGSASLPGNSTVTDPIIVAAKSLGINTQGLTKEELSKKILGLSTK